MLIQHTAVCTLIANKAAPDIANLTSIENRPAGLQELNKSIKVWVNTYFMTFLLCSHPNSLIETINRAQMHFIT
jgi:hypothetical protein